MKNACQYPSFLVKWHNDIKRGVEKRIWFHHFVISHRFTGNRLFKRSSFFYLSLTPPPPPPPPQKGCFLLPFCIFYPNTYIFPQTDNAASAAATFAAPQVSQLNGPSFGSALSGMGAVGSFSLGYGSQFVVSVIHYFLWI